LLNEVGDKVFVITSIEDQGFVVHAPGEDNGLFFGYWVDFTNVKHVEKESEMRRFAEDTRVTAVSSGRHGVIVSGMDIDGDYRVKFGDVTEFVHNSNLVPFFNPSDLVNAVKALIDRYGEGNVTSTIEYIRKVSA
jgi:hydrogenase maturation factor